MRATSMHNGNMTPVNSLGRLPHRALLLAASHRTTCPQRSRALRGEGRAGRLCVHAVLEDPSSSSSAGGSGRALRQATLRWARRQRLLPHEPQPGEEDVLELNVGGKLMQTTRSTLLQVPGSRLAALFRREASSSLPHDAQGRIFLDYDPACFQLVLRYLRDMKMMSHGGGGGSASSGGGGGGGGGAQGGASRGGRACCLPAVAPGDEAYFRALLANLGLMPAQVASQIPIPLATMHDPLTDEPLAPMHHHPFTWAAQQQQNQQQQQPLEQAAQALCEHGGGAGKPLGGAASHAQAPQTSACRHAQPPPPQQQQHGGRSLRDALRPPPLAWPPRPLGGGALGSSSGSGGGDLPRQHHLGAHRTHPHSAGGYQQQQQHVLPEAEMDSEDLIPCTATSSILSSGSSGSGPVSSPSGSSSSGSSGSRASGPCAFSRTPMTGGSSGSTTSTAPALGGSSSGKQRPAGHAGNGCSGSSTLAGSGSSGLLGDTARLVPPPQRTATVSQLFYIQAQYEARRGLRVSVFTEGDLRAASAAGPSDIFCDATYGDAQLSFTFVSRKEFDGVFLGVTSRAQLDRKGAHIPCYGWKSSGCTYGGGGGGSSSGDHCGSAPGGGSGSSASGPGGLLGKGVAGLARHLVGLQGGRPVLAASQAPPPGKDGAAGRLQPTAMRQQQAVEPELLWSKGDSVELIMRQGSGRQANQLVLKVNGRHVDMISHLPSFKNWAWYVGMWTGGDMSCTVFQKDSYAVYYSDYMVKRFI